MKFQSLYILASVAVAHPLVTRTWYSSNSDDGEWTPSHYGKSPSASYSPTPSSTAITDVTILQYALFLEHLENVFYKGGLSQFSEDEFVAAGFSAAYYTNLEYIAHDEEAHVLLLESAITAAGGTPNQACTYSFPYTDAKSFVTLASVLEGVGSAAYLGAAPSIASKAYLSVAGAILDTEAIHTAIQRTSIGEIGPANPYGSSLTFNSVYTLAAAFVTMCPTSNPTLPFIAFPTLTSITTGSVSPGSDFKFDKWGFNGNNAYITWVNGLTVVSSVATVNGDELDTVVPSVIQGGQTYAFLTNTNLTAFDESHVLAGPAVVEVTPQAPTYSQNIL